MVTTLFRHPRIHTLAPGAAPASAIAVRDGVIQAVGDYRELAEQAPQGSQTVELPGAAVLPGFHDAHIHAGNLAREHDALDLRGADSLETALDRVRAHAEAHPGTGWIFGGRWDANAWAVPRQPNRFDLDRVCPDRPIALPSVDGHTIWVNSRALAEVGIDARTPDPVGGVIVRDELGEPTGIFREAATAPFDALRHSPHSGNLDEQLARTQQRLLALGLTSITDIDGEDVRDALLRMHAAQSLDIRVHKAIPLTALTAAIAEGRFTGQGDDVLSCGPVKIFSDGALGSHTAHMSEDFAGEPGNRGIEIV
ncbi:amidohydrolase, partial [Leucobacter sp. M11]|uniref:amidohydrolase n=1 Tax=Leucobacter sp. M11 TaxID=2993565 RepID=UPI002D7E33D8